MPPAKQDGAVSNNTVTLAVAESFTLPAWYKEASPLDVGRALTLGATLLAGEVPPSLNTQVDISSAVSQMRQECLEKREEQLQQHESSLATITAAHKTELELQRSTLRAEIDRMAARIAEDRQAAEAKLKKLINENDDLEAKVSTIEEGGAIVEPSTRDAVRSHFDGFAQHTCELLAALAKHHALIDRLDRSAVNVRAKIFTYYRLTKRLNASADWLNVEMVLPWEHAYEHAIAFDRPWNNITKSKAIELENSLGREAFKVCKRNETKRADE